MTEDIQRQIRKFAIIVFPVLLIGALMLALSPKQKDGPVFRAPSIFTTQEPLPPISPPYPSEVFDLGNWKVTLPVTDPERPKQPLDILQPDLATYKIDPWFMPTKDKKGIVFRAPVNAPTTGDTDYPRSELREMTDDGKKVAYWSSEDGVHTLFLDEAITAVPKKKPHVVAGQIHGDDDDLLVIRLEYPKLYLTRSKKNLVTLDEHYVLGKRFTVKFVADDGRMSVYYDGNTSPVYTLEKKVSQAYFKAGVYTQSNCETEEDANLCTADNYGEVVIYRAIVTHDP